MSARYRVGGKPDLVAERDQLLARLRDAEGFPLSTVELGTVLGPRLWVSPCRRCGGTGTTEFTAHNRHLDAYTHLEALRKKGLVEKVKVDGVRAAYWRATEEPQP